MDSPPSSPLLPRPRPLRASDVAVVKVDPPQGSEPLAAAQCGCSGRLRTGEWVVAMGSPLMLKHSVTAGIVSCVERRGCELGLKGAATSYIQTDAALSQVRPPRGTARHGRVRHVRAPAS